MKTDFDDRLPLIKALIVIFVFFGGAAAGYVYYSGKLSFMQSQDEAPAAKVINGIIHLNIYYPMDGWLEMQERKAPATMTIAEATLIEFLKGPAGGPTSYVPAGTRLLGVYQGSDEVLYVNLSDEFQRNFQGDTIAEFLLLRGLFESIASNVEGALDVKVLIEGKETNSLGGHLHLRYPLRESISQVLEESSQ